MYFAQEICQTFSMFQGLTPFSLVFSVSVQPIFAQTVLGVHHLISGGGGIEVFWKKLKQNKTKLHPLLRLKKDTSLTWVKKKKKLRYRRQRKKKNIQPNPEIRWRNGNFWLKKKSPTCETKKKQNFIHLRSKKKTLPPLAEIKKIYPTSTSMPPPPKIKWCAPY